MSLPDVRSRDEWLAARKELLAREKELTRVRDALNADRRRLPMVRIDKPYVFEGPGGKATLLDLFEGRRQLIVQHFMFDPSWEDGCPSCSADADELLRRACSRTCTSATRRSPPSRARRSPSSRPTRRARAGRSRGTPRTAATSTTTSTPRSTSRSRRWRSTTATRAELEAAAPGHWALTAEQPIEMPGISCFLREGDDVFHTYSTFARGTEAIGGAYAYPRPDGARPPGGLGGAQGPRRRSARRDARLRRVSTFEPVSDARARRSSLAAAGVAARARREARRAGRRAHAVRP